MFIIVNIAVLFLINKLLLLVPKKKKNEMSPKTIKITKIYPRNHLKDENTSQNL